MQTERDQQPISSNGEFRIVDIAQVEESKTNPRKHFAKDALQDLTRSVKEKGILVPLLVRPLNWKSNGFGNLATHDGYEVVAGARRYRAAKAAGLQAIPVIARILDDEQMLEVQVIENLQREDVHPLEEAEGYKQLLAKGKYEIETLADKIGKSVSYIYQRLKLAELVPAAKKAFQEEKITAGHAILLARLQPLEQKEGLDYCQDRWRKPSVRDLGDWIQQNVHLDLAKAPWKKDDADLVPAAGACTTCPKRTGFAKALFPDVDKGDTCTDPKCFREKGHALIQIRVKENPGVQLVSGSPAYSLNESEALKKKYPGLLMEREYRKAGAIKCKDTVEALVIEGAGAGTKIRICTGKRCKKHGPVEHSYRPKPRTAKEIAAQKKRDEKDKLDSAVSDAAYIAAVNRVKTLKQLPLAVWQLIAQSVSYGYYGADDTIRKALGAKARNINPRKIFKQQELNAFIFAHMIGAENGNLGDKDCLEAFRLVGVNLAEIRIKITAEAKAAQPARGVCRICGCGTKEKPACEISLRNGKGGFGGCSWTDKTKTLCTNPKCLAAAKAQTSAKKKAA